MATWVALKKVLVQNDDNVQIRRCGFIKSIGGLK